MDRNNSSCGNYGCLLLFVLALLALACYVYTGQDVMRVHEDNSVQQTWDRVVRSHEPR